MTYVHNRIMHKSQKVDTIQMSINRQMKVLKSNVYSQPLNCTADRGADPCVLLFLPQ